MGNNHSRGAAPPHSHQPGAHHAHHRSNPVPASPSSPTGPTRTASTSSRKPGSSASRHSFRRNSLQSPGPLYADMPARPGVAAAPPRRESIAEAPMEPMGHAASLLGRVSSPLSAAAAFAPPVAPEKRRGSMDSVTTIDEDDGPADARTVPTLVEWPHAGNKVYLTGTFCGWAKRFKLTRNGDVMSALVPIQPGTHHVKFIVDGEMQHSSSARYLDLPGRDVKDIRTDLVRQEMRPLGSAVDESGVLVNYLEVSADEIPPLQRQASATSASAPVAHERLPPDAGGRNGTTEIPRYLRDLDPDDESRHSLPAPPSLPMMLQKNVLNTSSQMKDDASVLGIPNHAVLNHLATSSIKNHVLAVSDTTRYKNKYVTTMLYRTAHE